MTKDEALDKALEALGQLWLLSDEAAVIANPAITAIKQALAQPAQQQKPVAAYGYCPECGAKGVMRERRPNGNDKCANGHVYPSNKAAPPAQPAQQQEPVAFSCFRCVTPKKCAIHGCSPNTWPSETPPQRTWVGLTDEERMDVLLALNWDKQLTHMDTAKAIEAKLKEKNT